MLWSDERSWAESVLAFSKQSGASPDQIKHHITYRLVRYPLLHHPIPKRGPDEA